MEANHLRKNNQALTDELRLYKNEQGAMVGQNSGALFNEEGKGGKRGRGVARSELHVNSDETDPVKKRSRCE